MLVNTFVNQKYYIVLRFEIPIDNLKKYSLYMCSIKRLDKIVIIPKGFRKLRNQKSSYVKYFTPRFIKIQTGQTSTWINRNSEPHELVSGNAEHGRPDGILNTGIIESSKSFSKRFDISSLSSIHYFCIRHPEERGMIIIYNKYEDEMDMKERIDHIKQVFTFDNIK